MSSILLNAGASKVNKATPSEAFKKFAESQKKVAENPKKLAEAPKKFMETPKPPEPSELKPVSDQPPEDEEDKREQRRATGRSVAIVIFLSLMCLALYHVIQKKTTILAGVS